MTICNMSIEAGARAGMISPDETTFEWLRDREFGPTADEYDALVAEWRGLADGSGCELRPHGDVVDVSALEPQVTWGTNPGMVVPVSGRVPDPASFDRHGGPGGRERGLWST